jgi:hypothetical protein
VSDAACLYRGRKGPQMDCCIDLYYLSPCGCPASVEGVGEAKRCGGWRVLAVQ